MDIHGITKMETYELESEFYIATETLVKLPAESKRRGELSREIAHMVFELNARAVGEEGSWAFS